jgi:hypothetical protein
MAPPAVRFRGGTVAVSSPDIASLTLVKPLPALARVYIGPWIPAYILSYYAFYHAYDTYIKSIGEYLTLLSQRVARLFPNVAASLCCSFRDAMAVHGTHELEGAAPPSLRDSCAGAELRQKLTDCFARNRTS